MGQVTVFSGVQRHRCWTDKKKHSLVSALSAPRANVAEISRLAHVRPGQIYRWRQQLEQFGHGFAQVQVQPDPDPAPVAVAGTAITVEFERAIVRIPAGASPGLAAAVLRSMKP